jgi:acetyltransferase-like isoleucine patch superfamily enzyme
MNFKTLKNKSSFNELLSPFNVLIKVNNFEIRIGRGSFSTLKKILVFKHQQSEKKLVLEVGDFCNANDSAKIILGGEHKNSLGELINTFQDCAFLASKIENKSSIDPTSKGLISIGNSVVLSANSIILSGSKIDNNSIVGASSLISGVYEENSVIAGNPAKLISKINPPNVLWWNYSLDSILSYFNGNFKPSNNHLSDFYICFDATVDPFGLIVNLNMTGIKNKDTAVQMTELSKPILNYFLQLKSSAEYIEINDQIFNEYL